VFVESRRHLPRSVFDAARWEKIAGPSWRKVVTVLTRGGRFDTQESAYKGDQEKTADGDELHARADTTFTRCPLFSPSRFASRAFKTIAFSGMCSVRYGCVIVRDFVIRMSRFVMRWRS
jgi:hypothetical protein